ncbi:MAG TPA: hypothetical protein VIN08_10830 [Ohtaekwangia sp.]|uniref:hypothetical protein n=1 Tax=Ohtaekwangia sp. TaxID=2066019 RepID=UPI002F95F8B2
MKKLLSITLLSCLSWLAHAHIGSPGVTFEGKAGAYAVMVLITPPDVIPGTATVDVYTQTNGIHAIGVKPAYWFAGDEGTPSADDLLPVEGEPGHFRGMVWLMSAGTSGIELDIAGESGEGKILVPVMAVSTAQKEMPSSLGWILLALCVLLVGLMITIIGASVGDGQVKPAEEITRAIARKRWIGSGVSLILLLLILWGGKTWWDSWSNRYKRFTYKPFKATSTIAQTSGKNILEFRIDTTRLQNLFNTRRLSYVIPDHGKLMHMFLVRAGSMDVFAHLHPQRKDSATYSTPLPPLPPGKYLVFADITRLTGFSETIPDTLEITSSVPAVLASLDSSSTDRDDTFYSTTPIGQASSNTISADNIVKCGKPGVKTTLADGSSAIWEHEANIPFTSGKLYELTFSILDEQGKPAILQPYLGMQGHAVVMKADGSTYIHLHPVGNYSMASQQTILTRFEKEAGPVQWEKISKGTVFMDSINHVVARLDAMTEDERNQALMGEMYHAPGDTTHAEHTVVKFPYAFPSPGNYRIWIQMKRNGKILNSAFDAIVE